MERRLTAILAADVVGYSRLMGLDEAGTLSALKAHRREMADAKIAEHQGRIVKLTGDGMLVEFPSVVNAVACAADIQRGMRERNADVPEDRRIEFRIGINLGDIIVEDDDIFGDGVNVAARLESIAEPGGIAISGSVRDQRRQPARSRLRGHGRADAEEHRAAGPGLSRRLGTASRQPLAAAPAQSAGAAEQAVDRRAALHQYERRSGAGIFRRRHHRGHDHRPVEDPGALRHRPQFVLRLQGQGRRHPHRSRSELGVRYVLEGSVRKAANRLRITGQLIEGRAATHVWADKFEGALEDIFDLQDRLTESIVGAIEPSLRRAEIERARRKRPDRLDAYDLYLQALATRLCEHARRHRRSACGFCDESLRLDPNYAAAHAYAAWCHEQRFFRGGFHPEDRAAALKHAASRSASAQTIRRR